MRNSGVLENPFVLSGKYMAGSAVAHGGTPRPSKRGYFPMKFLSDLISFGTLFLAAFCIETPSIEENRRS